jgi:hypothetical protein
MRKTLLHTNEKQIIIVLFLRKFTLKFFLLLCFEFYNISQDNNS